LIIYTSQQHPQFALLNKDFSTIAKPLLREHRERLEKNAVVERSDACRSKSIPLLLKAIDQDPTIAYYIRQLTVSDRVARGP